MPPPNVLREFYKALLPNNALRHRNSPCYPPHFGNALKESRCPLLSCTLVMCNPRPTAKHP